MKYFYKGKFNLQKLHPLNIDYQTVSRIPCGCRVLEIGCADGFMGEYLMKKKKCSLVGVEIDQKAGKKARARGLEIIEGDIEQPEVYRKLKIFPPFDIILASSIIEHLKEPGQSLVNWKKFLKTNGFLIVTVPNIAHWAARLKILSGKFDYEKYGIFDENHLRFFTEKSFKKLISSAGYKIEFFGIDPVGGGFPKISRFLSLFFPKLFAYQMIIKAKLY
ncbi:MAG: bifunctional 3-demethylubiquinone-9 3-methyltransferase/ 2-octaprenyl-6-hydroxy phenol methylase [Microgenomates group bacterium ADurb.Bin219]|nr:MAG: bifunctional 3-demethylubiquinone-9 3-methyltransferase/ 2-octaprenyl-6-hydroxy phenol methylase [Microgenomates group bacterium ADurb.Bin219]HNP89652.1 methionine biosynthesis protein MetW [Candidatus Woesebacteria bacterium]